ncbi:T9SS type A sorting domain-containing protein [candidate division KSB1 bacterium]|nr:T9SS type A sorting domain-containing protein [candidate division KSB1 bacterium]
MKRKNPFRILFFGIAVALSANPVDNTPIARFSELVFDAANQWTLELYFPFEYQEDTIDSIIINASSGEAKINAAFAPWTAIGLITSDSLSIPVPIHRDGDTIQLSTYSSREGNHQVRIDRLIFGNTKGASVGPPAAGYSIMRNVWTDRHLNVITMDCLAQNHSLGAVNDTLGLSGTLKGVIYDSSNRPVTGLKVLPASPSRFYLHTSLAIETNGAYHTQIFRKFPAEAIDHLYVRLDDFAGWLDSVAVQPFQLYDIQPDTTMILDIRLMDDEYVLTDVKERNSPLLPEVTLINYPNPFNASTNFHITIHDLSPGTAGTITIYSASGQLVKQIPLDGHSLIKWDATDMNGRLLPSGVYRYRLDFYEKTVASGSLIFLK